MSVCQTRFIIITFFSDAPRCAIPPTLQGVGMKEPVNVTCTVLADPPDVTFYWSFNNSVRREQSESVGSDR